MDAEYFISILVFLGLAFLVWDCYEVGRNDAANIVNAVFGSRILRRKTAVLLAGIAVVLGATASSGVMETARKGIFDPTMLTVKTAIIVYISVYIVDTVLLYTYSAFGMPVSTTACLVFELVGASLGLAGFGVVTWPMVAKVVIAIVVSIIMSGIAGFLIQRVFRAAIRDKVDDHPTILMHGPWIGGLMITGLAWFLVMKGLKQVTFVKMIKEATIEAYGEVVILFIAWGACTLLIFIVLKAMGERGTRHLFHVTALVGMICLAFAFGQNDLANCASPGLSAWTLYSTVNNETELQASDDLKRPLFVNEADGEVLAFDADAEVFLNTDENEVVPESTTEKLTTIGFEDDYPASMSKIPIQWWMLFGCGLIIFMGMRSKHAQRVTRAAANTGSQFDHVALYAPQWCQSIALWLLKFRPKGQELAPEPTTSERGKKVHYDALRASVIMAVSASVIALASSQKLPVSTTYVAFAAVVATGLADRVMARGDAELKIGRTIWVVFSWFMAAGIAVAATAFVANLLQYLTYFGLAVALGANFGVRYMARRAADKQEERVHARFERKRQEQGGTSDDEDLDANE